MKVSIGECTTVYVYGSGVYDSGYNARMSL